MLCPGRPAQRTVEGYQHYPNEALLWGSGMHLEIEQRLAGEPLKPGELEVQLHDIFIKDVPDFVKPNELRHLGKVTTKAQRQLMVRQIRAAADNWEQNVLPTIEDKIWTVEQTLRALVGEDDEYQVWMQGTPDLVVEDKSSGHVGIIDWKSAGRMWSPKKIEGQMQPIFYPWMYDESFGVRPKSFTFWVYDRSADFWAEFTIATPVDSRLIPARVQAFNAAVQMDRDEWTWQPSAKGGGATRGWHCSTKYCDAWDVCSGKHLIADGKASVQAPTLRERFEV